MDRAKRIITEASKVVPALMPLLEDKDFLELLNEEIKEASKEEGDLLVHFGSSSFLGIRPTCEVVNDSVVAISLLSEAEVFSSLKSATKKLGKTTEDLEKVFKDVKESYLSEKNVKIEELTKSQWREIAESVCAKLINAETDTENAILTEADLNKIIESITTSRKKEALRTLEQLLKLDVESKKRALLDKLLGNG
jgi:prefoldin subunit 5